MKWETKVLREIAETYGTLTDETGNTVEVRFTLTQTQDFDPHMEQLTLGT
jgi:hypothetical protein